MHSYLKNGVSTSVNCINFNRHSKTCRKYKNEVCSFKFENTFDKETLVNEPLPESMPEEVKVLVLSKMKEMLLKVKNYINNFLNPSKINFFDRSRNDFTEIKSISKVLKEFNISEEEYESALKISDDNGFRLHLRQPTALSVITLIKVCLHGKRILTISQYLITIKLSLICVVIYLNKRMNVLRL